jgi:hypothetical protein
MNSGTLGLDLRSTCMFCAQPLRFLTGKGWRHELGGGVYMMRCECGWSGALDPTPAVCPRCGSRRLRDDHCATARMS